MSSKKSNKTRDANDMDIDPEAYHDDVMDTITGHYSGIKLNRIEVPEWLVNGKPMEIYHKAITVKEQRNIYKMIRKDDIGFFVETLLVRALKSDGTPLFDKGDKFFLTNRASYNVIASIINKMIEADDDESMEELEGN